MGSPSGLLWLMIAIFALLILGSLILALFFTKHGTTPPLYQQRFAWRSLSQLIWLAALLLFVGGPLLAGFLWKLPISFNLTRMIFTSAFPVALLAPPIALLLSRGNFDFSISGVTVLSGILFAYFANKGSPELGVALALAFAFTVGILNALVVSVTRISSLLVTLTSAGLFVGLASLFTNESQILLRSATRDLTREWTFLWWGLVFLECALLICLAELTPIGRPGKIPDDQESTLRRIATVGTPFLISALAAGIAGIYFVLRTQMASPFMGGSYLFRDALLVTVLGGTAWNARNPALLGAVVAALLLQALQTLLSSLAFPTYSVEIILGPALLAFALLALQYHNLTAWLYHGKQSRPPAGFPVTPNLSISQ